LRPYGRPVTDPDVIHHTHLPRQGNILTQLSAAGDANLGGHDGVLADNDVVRDLNQIIDFCAVPDDRLR
jgi:hypothetical protein